MNGKNYDFEKIDDEIIRQALEIVGKLTIVNL